jgi:histidine phosphotransferase ChpT
MSGPIALESLDLAALLCSRVCHELIRQVGAIVIVLDVFL